MILAMARILALSLIRDLGALAMVLVLPPVIYIVFASIFSTASGDEPELRIGVTSAGLAPRIEAALRASPLQTVRAFPTEAALRRAVGEGTLDAGLVARGDATQLTPPPLAILVDPAKPMAGAVLDGRIRALLAKTAPAILLERQAAQMVAVIGPLTRAQSVRLDAALMMPADGDAPLIATERVGEDGAPDPAVTYYAGAIAVMFLLFSSTQAATGLIDDREAGILDRLATGPGGVDVAVLGRALLLTVQGMVQAGAVFAVAALLYNVPVAAHLPLWAVGTAFVAAAAAGFSLLCAAACRTRAQAQAVSTFLVLVASALGVSMVPRFLMPDWLRNLGAVSPNAWAIELYEGILARGTPLAELAVPAAALAALAVGGTGMAVMASRRRMRL